MNRLDGLRTYAATPAVFETGTTTGTLSVSGILYRAIPHGATAPLDSSQSLTDGGRWNHPGSFPVLYTGSSIDVVKSFVEWRASYYGLPLRARTANDLPDLVVVAFESIVADAATDAGLSHHGLPSTYPVGFPPQDHAATQPIGRMMFDAGMPGVATRSATMTSWAGPITSWAEVAIFTTQSPEVRFLDRFEFQDWYRDA